MTEAGTSLPFQRSHSLGERLLRRLGVCGQQENEITFRMVQDSAGQPAVGRLGKADAPIVFQRQVGIVAQRAAISSKP